jgi:hypothetical protein
VYFRRWKYRKQQKKDDIFVHISGNKIFFVEKKRPGFWLLGKKKIIVPVYIFCFKTITTSIHR